MWLNASEGGISDHNRSQRYYESNVAMSIYGRRRSMEGMAGYIKMWYCYTSFVIYSWIEEGTATE